MTALLLAISGQAVIEALIVLVVFGLIFWLLWWFVGYVGLPEPFHKVATVLLALGAVVVLINVLLSIVGRPFITW